MTVTNQSSHLKNTFRQRSWILTCTTVELEYAIKLGYKVVCFYEIYHFSQRAEFLSPYMTVLASYMLRVCRHIHCI